MDHYAAIFLVIKNITTQSFFLLALYVGVCFGNYNELLAYL